MAETLELEVATPEHLLVRAQATEVQLPGKDGALGILPGHAALLGQLGDGVLSYTAGGQPYWLAVDGGFVEVLDDHVRVLADAAVKAEDIHAGKAKAELQRATDALPTASDPDAAIAAVNRAQARVNAAERKS